MRQISRLEVIETGARRRWTPEEKQRIVAESFGAPRIVSATARRHGLSNSQLFTWRRLAREGKLSVRETLRIAEDVSTGCQMRHRNPARRACCPKPIVKCVPRAGWRSFFPVRAG